jgi:hypothetical protein
MKKDSQSSKKIPDPDPDAKPHPIVEKLPEFVDIKHQEHISNLYFLTVFFQSDGDDLMGKHFSGFKNTYLSKLPEKSVNQFIQLILSYILTRGQDIAVKTTYKKLISFLSDPAQGFIYTFLTEHKTDVFLFMNLYFINQNSVIGMITSYLSFFCAPYFYQDEFKDFLKVRSVTHLSLLYVFNTINDDLKFIGKKKDFHNQKTLTEHYKEIFQQAPTIELLMSESWKDFCRELSDLYLRKDNRYYSLRSLRTHSSAYETYSDLLLRTPDNSAFSSSQITVLWKTLSSDILLTLPEFKPKLTIAPAEPTKKQPWNPTVKVLTDKSLLSIVTRIATKKQIHDRLLKNFTQKITLFLAYEGASIATVLWKQEKSLTKLAILWQEFIISLSPPEDSDSDDDSSTDDLEDSIDSLNIHRITTTPPETKSKQPSSSPRQSNSTVLKPGS